MKLIKSQHSFKILITLLILSFCFELTSCKSKSYTGPEKINLSRKKRKKANKAVIATSKKYIGTPYKWGGTTRAGMDCSGLLYTSYNANGLNIPRSSKDQAKFGKRVSIKHLKSGDWVFFATGKKKRKITHVGLVTQVNKKKEDVKFIHASTSLGVMESQLFSSYWRKRFRRAIRPIR